MSRASEMLPLCRQLSPVMVGKHGLPYRRRQEAHNAAREKGLATDPAEWVEAVALHRRDTALAALPFVAAVKRLAEDCPAVLVKLAPFLSTVDDQLTVAEIMAGSHPTPRYFATLVCGYQQLSADQQAKWQARVAHYLKNDDPAKEKRYFSAFADGNAALAALLRERWRRARGMPSVSDTARTPAERLAEMMGWAVTPPLAPCPGKGSLPIAQAQNFGDDSADPFAMSDAEWDEAREQYGDEAVERLRRDMEEAAVGV